jgi:hypothetical protein
MTYVLTELGFMREPFFHDGNLNGLMAEGDTVRLNISTVHGEKFWLTLSGVEGFTATNFKLGNIVFDIRLLTRTNVGADQLSDIYPSPHPSADKRYHEANLELIRRKCGEILRGELTLFEITTSYGCEVSAVCQNVSVAR